MSCRSPTCACCEGLTSIHEEVLYEMNLYRKLLRMDPLQSITAFETKKTKSPNTAADTALDSMSVQASHVSLSSMPSEILDLILCYMDANSIMNACHSLPYYKHISHAMHSMALMFPTHYRNPSKLWPDFELPMAEVIDSDETDSDDGLFTLTEIPSNSLHAIHGYGRLISKYGGAVLVLPVSEVVVNNLLGVLPTVITLLEMPEEFGPVDRFDVILQQVLKEKKVVRELYFPSTSDYFHDDTGIVRRIATVLAKLPVWKLVFSDSIPQEVDDALRKMRTLRVLELSMCSDYMVSLVRCKSLVQLDFRYPDVEMMEMEGDESIAAIVKSKIREVRFLWQHWDTPDKDKLKAIAGPQFLLHGWIRNESDAAICWVPGKPKKRGRK
ncbi:hypothetical protein HDU78_000568 [Chytriomyces hyalinus]|nr:hypothetical protein HDU78_000568 [Chytriomyces hyalinus]